MILWTIQTAEALQHLERKLRLRGDWRRVPKDYRQAYQWMTGQLSNRLGIPTRRPPLWAWHSYDGAARRRPDLRTSGHLPRGTRGVRLELDAPEELVLLSDFMMWHCVLNDHYLSLTATEEKRAEAMERAGELTRRMIIESWEKMFDLSRGSSYGWGPKKRRSIQGCLPWLELDWVKRVDRFAAR